MVEHCVQLKKLVLAGHTIDATQIDWGKVTLSELCTMLRSKNYECDLHRPIKESVILQIYDQEQQPEAEAYIKKHSTRIFQSLIKNNDYENVRKLAECDRFINRKNIMKLVGYSIERTQKGGEMQIQVFLMNYKYRKFPDMDVLGDLTI